MIFPSPTMYDSWQAWAEALTKLLQEDREGGPVRLPQYKTVALPPAPAYPACWAFSTTLGQPVFSDGTEWLRLDGTPV
jgi:hypothetical protein